MEWTEIILFTLGGKPVLLVDLLSSLLGLTCVFLAGRNSKYNFWLPVHGGPVLPVLEPQPLRQPAAAADFPGHQRPGPLALDAPKGVGALFG